MKPWNRFKSLFQQQVQLKTVPDPILRQTAAAVAVDELPRAMKALSAARTLMQRKQGVGIAAPQIGISSRFFAIEDAAHGLPFLPMFNPQLVRVGGVSRNKKKRRRIKARAEACLSVPNQVGVVRRDQLCTLQYVDADNQPHTVELAGFWAVVAQHELDHLNGVLFVDKLAVDRLWSDAEFDALALDDIEAIAGLHDFAANLDGTWARIDNESKIIAKAQ